VTAMVGALLLLAPPAARADVEGIVRYGVTPQSLQDDFINDYGERKNYRPVRLTGYLDAERVRYFTRWVPNDDGRQWYVYFGKTSVQYHQLFLTLRAQGYHPVDVSGYQSENGIRYAAIWEKNTAGAAWKALRDVTREGMQDLVDTIGKEGWVPRRVEAYVLGGESRYISIWEYAPGEGYRMHNKMTREQYDNHLHEYENLGYALVHLDAHTINGDLFYAGIWSKRDDLPRVRSNRNAAVFQRYYNNYWVDGYFIDNFYAAETPQGTRYGGIWFGDGPLNITPNSSLHLRVRKEVDGAPARGGAAIINLETGAEVMVHADQVFTVASTIKIGILYALLREIDAGSESWNGTIDSGAAYGNNQGNWLQPNTDYTISQMAGFMIRSSNNWATNRLIDRIGMDSINDHLSDLGLERTRLLRYMTGTGAPSAHGNANASEDREEGWENRSTPREMVTLLKRIRNENLLTGLSRLRFWATLKMDGDNDGVNEKSYFAAQINAMGFNPAISVFNKNGSLSTTSLRIVRADAGALVLPGANDVVVLAVFMDEISDDPDTFGVASNATRTAAETAIKNVAKEVANEYYP
jgi:beta-lactamase class A